MGTPRRIGHWFVLTLAFAMSGGCMHFHDAPMAIPDVPNERQKTILPEYVIESPDLLQIDLLYAVPLPTYKIQSLDVLLLKVANAREDAPIAGLFPVDLEGKINLGEKYGSVKVSELTVSGAKAAVVTYLKGILKDPQVTELTIAEGRGVQLIRGQHLVRPDGSVNLGSYGSVIVAGLTAKETKERIEEHLTATLNSPEVVVSVIGYNSKVYYVIFDFGGAGQQVLRLPVTGNDTVLDAISQLNGLPSVSDLRNVRVARSTGAGEPDQILPVDWIGLTSRGRSETNYQLVPGDRIFVKAYPMAEVDTRLARVISPIERLLGFTLLGATTYNNVKFANTQGGSGF